MNLKTTLSFLFTLTVVLSTVAQEPQPERYKRVKISGNGVEFINRLAEAGVDLVCGAVFDTNSIQLELSEFELQQISNAGFSYDVIIDDLTTFYRERAEANLPIARRNLEIEKRFNRFNKTPRANAFEAVDAQTGVQSVTISNIAQTTNLKQEIDWLQPDNFNLGSMGGAYTNAEIEAILDDMRAKFPNLISIKQNASPTNQLTWEGNTIWTVKISDNPDSDEAEPQSLITGMLHSREAVAQINVIYYMWYLLENYATDPSLKTLVDNAELYFIPVANPDGLARNEVVAAGGGGMQRKNRNPNACSTGFVTRGVDLNRNFGYFYNTGGTSSTPCFDTYRGTGAFSEPETQIFRDFSLTKNFKTAQNHHTSANVMVHPFSGISSNPQAIDELTQFSHDLTEFNRYVFGPVQLILTLASGDSNEWMRGGVNDGTGSTGSGRNTWATTAESGNSNQEGSFWPNPTQIVDISKRAMRMNFVNSYYAGKFAKFHDLTPANITDLSTNIQFGIERLGQTQGNFTLELEPVSSNIVSISAPATQTGMNILEMRNVSANLVLSPSITPRETIQFRVRLRNEDHILYEAILEKTFSPTVFFSDTAEAGNLNNWVTSGGSWVNTNISSFNGSRSYADATTTAYTNNLSKTIRTANTFDFSEKPSLEIQRILVQFYTKWDIERNFDYVSFQGSVDGVNWIDMHGNYTKPAAGNFTNSRHMITKNTASVNFQDAAEFVFDGDRMNKWVMEEFVIDANSNSFLKNATNARFRFLFRTDENNLASGATTAFDGFFFDDFKIVKIDQFTLSNEDFIADQGLKIFPNPFVDEIQINWSELKGESFSADVYDLRGRLVFSRAFETSDAVITLNKNSLASGIYLLKLKSASGLESTQKLVKM